MEEIKAAAEAYMKSYESTIKLGHKYPQVSIQEYGSAIAAHYGPGFTSYTSGHRNTSGSRDAEIESVTSYLDRLVKSGLGVQFSLDKYRVEVVAAHGGGGSALCYATWRIHPLDGRESWNWENVYAFRLLPSNRQTVTESQTDNEDAHCDCDSNKYVTAKGYWEFVVSDNELEELVKRVPTIFDDTFGKK